MKTTLVLNVMKARGRKEKERGRREVEMLKSLDSNFVIRLVDAFEGRSEVILSQLIALPSQLVVLILIIVFVFQQNQSKEYDMKETQQGN